MSSNASRAGASNRLYHDESQESLQHHARDTTHETGKMVDHNDSDADSIADSRQSDAGDAEFWEDRQVESSEKRTRRANETGARGSREKLYKMEEGGSYTSSVNSSQSDIRELDYAAGFKRRSRAAWCGKLALIHVAIVAAFLALLYGGYRASRSTTGAGRAGAYVAKTLSNGTHVFAPTTIIISLDGFRADFLYRNLTPNLSSFVREGASPPWMLPSFPSLTFPNHFTLVTGKYPESHGIVGNSFWDPSTQKEFSYGDPAKSMTPEWWNAEPVWETAEKAGLRTAIHMWPGSEAHIDGIEPTFVDKYNGDELLDRKVSKILSWLDLPSPDDGAGVKTSRPQLIAAYVPNVDSDGHLFGPNSTYIRSTIREVDGMLGVLLKGLTARNLTEIVNVIIVSDHGMATTSTKRLIQLEDLLDTSEIEHTDGWPLYGLRPYNTSAAKIQELHDHLQSRIKETGHDKNCDIYLREEIPERYHFRDNDRIAPLWIVPRVGWAIVMEHEFSVKIAIEKGVAYHPRGLHGYDNQEPLMRAIFLARGPAFPHPRGSYIEPFQNTEVYNILCDSLGITPVANNGTLRLPLSADGVHDFDKYQAELVDDIIDVEDDGDAFIMHPELDNTVTKLEPVSISRSTLSVNLATSSSTTTPSLSTISSSSQIAPMKTIVGVKVEPTSPTRPEIQDGQDPADARKDRTWWEWIKSQLDKAKGWAADTFGPKPSQTAADNKPS